MKTRKFEIMIKKVLIVDDEQEICLLLSNILKSNGLKTYTANSLSEANELLKDEPFDLAFLDLNLPDGVGFQLIPVLKAHNKDIKCVIISAYNGISEKQRAKQEGADFFIGKPFNKNSILETVKLVS
ncbi:MAG: response regulator [Thermonemataceae bacterium]